MSEGRDPWHDGLRLWEALRARLGDAAAARRTDALGSLGDVRSLRQVLDRVERTAVEAARQHGHSWAEIAARLGVTRQSAWERWRDVDVASALASAASALTVSASRPEQADAPAPEPPAPAAEPVGTAPDAAGVRRRRSTVRVPDVVGLPFESACSVLTGRGLVPVGPGGQAGRDLTEGVVTDQSPESGARVTHGSRVILWLGRGGSAGVREPRRPTSGPKGLRTARDEPADETVG